MNQNMSPLFTMNLGEAVDLSWLAPDQPSYECTGRPVILVGIGRQTETLLPCGWVLPADCFRPNPVCRARHGARRWRPVRSRCVECEERIRTAKNRLNYWGRRIATSVRRHYRIERHEGL